MERRAFETPLGEVWLWSEWPEAGRPLVMLIHGAKAKPRPLTQSLQRHIPETQLVATHIPGNHCPELVRPGVASMGEALSAVLMAYFPGRPVLVIGESLGAVVALSMKAPGLRRRLLIEPPLVTDDVGDVGPVLAELVAGVHDYRPLLATLDTPAWVMVGDQRAWTTGKVPSLVRPVERQLFMAHPNVRLILVGPATTSSRRRRRGSSTPSRR